VASDLGNMVPTVDYRSVYATMLDQWLAADADGVLSASYQRLDLFRGHPGDPAAPPPPGQMSTITQAIGGPLQRATRVQTGVPVDAGGS
jgi:hypothetical protein